MSGLPLNGGDEEIQEKILDLLLQGDVKLGISDDGNVGVWLWGQEVHADLPYASAPTPSEALYAAALKHEVDGGAAGW